MKKSFLYIAGLGIAAFGVFAAFSDPAAADKMTDEQKIEAAVKTKSEAFKAQKAAECEQACLQEATTQFDQLKAAAEAAAAANTNTKTKTGSKTKPAPTPTPGTGSQPNTPSTTTVKPTDPKDGKMSGTGSTDTKDSKMSGGK